MARNYHGCNNVTDSPKFPYLEQIFREIENFRESKTISTNYISSLLKSICIGFHELLKLDRITNLYDVIINRLILVYDSLFHSIEIWEYHGQRTISLQKSVLFDLWLVRF
jgi:hypothetical protein